MDDLTPSAIVKELDKYIIGQKEAKKCVAIALRNRYRRKLLSDEMKDEITPKNIIMIGPTGVGKTEIARRLAKLVSAPFIKVEATKFTEVGYVGRDVESMIRDLANTSIRLVKQREEEKVEQKVAELVNDRLLEIIAPSASKQGEMSAYEMYFGGKGTYQKAPENDEKIRDLDERRESLRVSLKEGRLEDMVIELTVSGSSNINIGTIGQSGMDEMTMNMGDVLGNLWPKRDKKRKATVAQARVILASEEAQKLLDMDSITEEGLRLAEQEGIIFLDEIDKIASGSSKGVGPDVSREGVQRDILPVVEGCTVNTKYGPIKTDYILFIGAGAFHSSKVTDLIPELQGRFPIKVKLDNLTEEDFKNILTQPQNAIIKQYKELLRVEGVDLSFSDDSLEYIAKIAFMENETSENIGARRLHTVMEKLLAEISFYAPDYDQETFVVTKEYVEASFKEEEEGLINDTAKYII
ncbi:MAG: ATP-dependent protease ATPase subunit HslU [Eubacteriaceae bacterium]|nr:ATP-dependent protease ATPase subunit HslU [Eubacteriaceae bacterium]